ncbi:LOG family protein [Salsipaludibacter albus]|uniref:LOG family protein n=1 Tax=Salsipaludibacter albus TaxID=2849650 RepID=UPI001EE4A37F|nr:hypothetical protein [Salsipaludibacter albus]MBY5162340.1 hypothetical protein [Salsipaludibacter albus]
MMESDAIPVQPFRTRLYGDDLLAGFDPADPASYAATHDFAVYRAWVAAGRDRASHIHAVAQAIHDSSISDALDGFTTSRRLVGIMGGHRMVRATADDAPYVGVVRVARALAGAGIVPTSGGGPGAMEATHLGARTATRDWSEVVTHLDTLASVPSFPDGVGGVVAADGAVDLDVLTRLHAWQRPAFAVHDATCDEPGVSLGVPTWFYGHEPPTPLATHHAKYFQNSVREHGLLAIARHGVVFFPGSAGTLQEVFQDACQNFYGLHGLVSPMVFVGRPFWTETLPAWPLLGRLFADTGMLALVDEPDDAVAFLLDHPPIPHP